jgi:hypothetical protein
MNRATASGLLRFAARIRNGKVSGGRSFRELSVLKDETEFFFYNHLKDKKRQLRISTFVSIASQ